MSADTPLIVHVIHRLAVGGLENGLVNLINRMPADRYRHAMGDGLSPRDDDLPIPWLDVPGGVIGC